MRALTGRKKVPANIPERLISVAGIRLGIPMSQNLKIIHPIIPKTMAAMAPEGTEATLPEVDPEARPIAEP